MKRITSVLLVILSVVMIIPMMIVGTSASSAYQTYTYSINGKALYSPDAYSAERALSYSEMGLDKNFVTPADIVTDTDGNIYIADTGNNRIVILNRYYECVGYLNTFVNEQGNNDALAAPKGVFVNDTSIWVCDTGKNRLVEFDRSKSNGYAFKQIMDAPESQLFGESATYTPVSMVIDQYGRFYIVSSTTYQGIIVMTPQGEFVGFIGAQAVTIGAWELIWRKFQTAEQQLQNDIYESVEYNSVAISAEGFIYATTAAIDEGSVKGALKSGDAKYLPVKLLNPAGDEIMRRNGFWPPAGEIDLGSSIGAGRNSNAGKVSILVDVAVGPAKTWSIIDSRRNKIYTYDYNGNLLFAFGDAGSMLGSVNKITSIAYQGDKMLVLDGGNGTINVYDRTEYGDLLIEAIDSENNLNFDYAIDCWERVLQRNANFDAAYVGIGNAYYRSAEYETALEYYQSAYETENWSESFKQVRKGWMESWFLLLVVVLIAIIIGILKFFGWAAKVNRRVATDGKARKTFGQEILYGFHVIFHPFDGFYDLKHEHRGSIRASLVFLALTVLSFFYQSVGNGYIFNPTRNTTTIFAQAIGVLVPFFLFVVANWCLTTLFEGEGSFKDIFIATSYSLLPIILFFIPSTILSNVATLSEKGLINMLVTLAFIWVGLLLFSGVMITHDYSLFKNLITIIGTVVAMAFIVFVVLLFSMLLSKLVSLVSNIVTEIQYRV